MNRIDSCNFVLWTGFASASRVLWVRPCDHCFGRMDLIEQDTNTPVDKASNWYVLFRTKRGKLLPFLIMIYKLQLWIRSSKVSSLCTQCSDRKYSFSSSATSWFRTPNFRRSKQQMKTPAKRRTGEVTASNVSTEQTWCTGESAYTGESITINRRIRFQRSTNRLAHRRISVHRLIDYH